MCLVIGTREYFLESFWYKNRTKKAFRIFGHKRGLHLKHSGEIAMPSIGLESLKESSITSFNRLHLIEGH